MGSDTICVQSPSYRSNVPTLLKRGALRFFFYSNEGDEEPHVHVQREGTVARVWLR